MRKKPYFLKQNIPKDLETDETITQNKNKSLKKYRTKKKNQIKQIKTVGYLDTKDEDKIQ